MNEPHRYESGQIDDNNESWAIQLDKLGNISYTE